MSEPEPAAPPTTLIQATVDLWVRYLVPLTILSAIALLPVIAVALLAKPPVDAAGASLERWLAWALIALAWPCQLVLVGGAAAIARGRPSQLGALRTGLRALGRAIVPGIAAMAAVLLGSLALALPGILLLGLTALAGASELRGAAAIADSIAISRRYLLAIALTAASLLVVDLGAVILLKLALLEPLAKPPRPAQLAALPRYLRMLAVVLVVASPLPAAALAMLRTRAQPGAAAAV